MKKDKRYLYRSKKELLAESLKLPKDMVYGDFKLSITGNREAFIENYRGIAEYSKNNILIQTKSGFLQFTGDNLFIDYYTNEDMKISGCISDIRFCKEREA